MAASVWIWERLAGVLWAGLVAGLFALGALERLELMTYDWRLRATPDVLRRDIVIVGIDSPSLKALAAWPWSRSVHAELVDRLTRAKARVIAFDVDFSTPRTRQEDADFAAAVSRSQRVVLAAFQEHRALDGGAVVEYASLPYPALLNAARAVGSINVPIDTDGAVRRAPIETPLLGTDGWSFAVQTARAYLDALGTPVLRTADGTLELGNHHARLGPAAEFFIRFMGGPWTVPVVSFVDVLRGAVPATQFADKIVLVGATSLDLQDFRVTPFRGAMAGVEIQANAIATILSARSHQRLPPTAVVAGILTIVAWWTLFLVSLRVWRQAEMRRRALFICLAGIATLAAIIASAVISFQSLIVVDMVPLIATGAGQILTSLIAGYVFAERRLELQRENIEALYRMGDETRDRASLDRLADLLFAQAHHLLGVDRLGLDLWPRDDAPTREWRSRPGDDTIPLPTALYEEFAARVRSTGLPVTATDLAPAARGVSQARPLRASLFVPLVAHNRVIGILQVHRERPTPFHEGEAKTLLTLATQVALNIENGRLLDDVRMLFQRSLEAFSTALDFKDNDTGGHSQRVALYAREVARRMGLTGAELDVIAQGALLHDIGKIAVPDRILRKPGTLSEDEWATMRQHPETGYRMLKTIQVPDAIATVVRQHHERFDGSGYPHGLRGTAISIGARIFTVVDFYDALTSHRPYRKAQPVERVLEDIRRAAGSHFDPTVVEAFLAIPADVLSGFRTQIERELNDRRAA